MFQTNCSQTRLQLSGGEGMLCELYVRDYVINMLNYTRKVIINVLVKGTNYHNVCKDMKLDEFSTIFLILFDDLLQANALVNNYLLHFTIYQKNI